MAFNDVVAVAGLLASGRRGSARRIGQMSRVARTGSMPLVRMAILFAHSVPQSRQYTTLIQPSSLTAPDSRAYMRAAPHVEHALRSKGYASPFQGIPLPP